MNNNIDALIFAFVVTFYSFSTCVFFDFIPPDLPPTCHSDRRSFRSWILRLRTFCPEKVCPERSFSWNPSRLSAAPRSDLDRA